MRNFIKMLVLAIVIASTPACAAVLGALPTIVQIVQDAMIILDEIDATAKPFFEREGNKQLLDDYNARMLTAKRTLRVALRASEGGKELSDDEIDAAFEDFREAYKEVLALLRENNLMTSDGSLKTAGGKTIDIDMPLALSRVEQ